MKLNKILKANADGVSFKKMGLDYQPVYFKSGYFVALTDREVKGKAGLKDIAEVEKLAKQLNIKRHYFGYWKDAKTQKEYLDLSIHVQNRSLALSIARLFNQKAIFDCLNLNCIYA